MVWSPHAGPPTGAFGGALWGHDPSEGSAEMVRSPRTGPPTYAFGGAPYGATILVRGMPRWCGPAYGSSYLSLRWSSLWGHDPREGCAEMGRGRHANPATGAFGGAPYGATILVRGVPKWCGPRMRALLLKPSVELPMGPRSS